LVFMLGCGVGLLAFSRVLSWLLHDHHQLSYGFITGMLLGSVSGLWPWQEAEGGYTMLLPALVCLVLGIAIVVLLQVAFSTKPSESSN
jgi:putative membrane protein